VTLDPDTLSRQEAARIIDQGLTDQARAVMRENVKAELYELASIALHAMSRAEFLELAAEHYDDCNSDLDPIGGAR